jgi:hypothetical protein
MVNDKMFMRNHCLKTIASLLGLAALLGITQPAQAQRQVTVIGWTNQTWRFNDTGVELGTVWRTNNYNDAVWAGSGTGLFGVEAAVAGGYGGVPAFANITTPMALGPNGNVTTNFYLRTSFSYFASNFVPGMQVFATNLMDDGSIVYLNGVEVARFRVAAITNTASVYATGGPSVEGTNEVFTIATNLLRIGVNANVMAVEVHQNAAGSSDITWAQTVVAVIPTALVITNQPQNTTNIVGTTATLTVGVSGGPVTTYTWQKETSPGSGLWGSPTPPSVNLPTYTIPFATLSTNSAGNYRVIAAGQLNSVTSTVARLVVIPDTTGPVMLSAEPASLGNLTNRVLIRWSETLNNATAIQTNNYRMQMFPATNIVVPILSVSHSSGNTILVIATNGPWFTNGSIITTNNYYITANNVRDFNGNNVVAPNSQVPLGFAQVTNVIPANFFWTYNPNYIFGDPATHIPPFYATNYVQDGNWAGPSSAVFGYDPIDPMLVTCIGTEATRVIPEGSRPTYFRTTFNWANPTLTAQLRLRSVVDDGLALYLNGNEIYRQNIPAAPAILNGDTVSLATVADGDCRTNSIPGVHTIRSGINYLAAAVYQTSEGGNEFGDLTFALELDTLSFRTSSLPTNPVPRLNMTRSGTNMVMSWTNSVPGNVAAGWALEYLTDTSKSAKRGPGNTNYFTGVWSEVQTNMSNPFTNNTYPGPVRIFRLRKAQVQ